MSVAKVQFDVILGENRQACGHDGKLATEIVIVGQKKIVFPVEIILVLIEACDKIIGFVFLDF
jgi:hypothetical protein